MRKLLVIAAACVLTLSLAGSGFAATLEWHGTLESKLAAARRKLNRITGSGVATVNLSGGGASLSILRLAGGITGSRFNPVTDPDTSATIRTIGVTATLGTGTLSNLNALPLAKNRLPTPGFSHLCLVFSNCSQVLSVELVTPSGDRGAGIGGILTIGGVGGVVRVSIVAAPWTLGSGTAINQTGKGNFKTLTVTGFVHGAASGATSTLSPSGVVQLIIPMQVLAAGAGANNDVQSLFTFMTLHFVPEPGLLLLLGAGVAGLGILGHKRLRK